MPSTILSDNGVTSGTSGLKSTGSNDGQLALQTTTSGGTATTALTIDTSQNTTLAGNATAKSFIPNNSTVPTDGLYLPAASTVALSTGTTERMRIDSSGRVGIGTTSPSSSSQLEVKSTSSTAARVIMSGTTNMVLFHAANDSGNFYFGSDNSTGSIFGKGNYARLLWADGAYPIIFATDNAERARITSGGYFKASNNGTYVSSTGSYHELKSDANDTVAYTYATNASYSNTGHRFTMTRSATSSYIFFRCESGGGVDDEFYLRGDGNAYADGTWNNNGADYAEFFESVNGQALTLGATVVLDGNKVREATDQDPAFAIIGVVRPKEPSKASMVVGNTAWNKWANKYLTDDFDRYIMEDHDVVEWEETVTDEEGKTSTKQHSYESHNIPAGITVPADATIKTHDDKGNKFQHYKLNPAWDKDAEYVNRENRPEWNIIGLLGQVKILKGQPVGDRWTKMRDVSATVEEWMIR